MANVTTGKMSKRYTKRSFIVKNIPCVEEEVTIDGDRKTYNKGVCKVKVDGREIILNLYVKAATEVHKVGGDDGDGKEINFYATIVGVKKKGYTYNGNRYYSNSTLY